MVSSLVAASPTAGELASLPRVYSTPKSQAKLYVTPTCGRYAAGRWADDPRPFLEVNLLSRSRIGRGHLGWQASLIPPHHLRGQPTIA